MYGASMLFMPFYEDTKQRVTEHGWRLLYGHQTGFLDIPPPWSLLQQALSSSGIEDDVLVRMVFPLLVGAGVVLTGFWGFHVMYVATGRTTLEHKILLISLNEAAMHQLRTGRRETFLTPKNPFHQGFIGNFRQILGPSLLFVVLPWPVDPLPPFIPDDKKK
uniref:Protein S-acyltransferase n=1 Tax=Grammatophora oceanica TaxID=210454 RepID=A0A7S1V6T4_9STRA|mmetsp:Transcript_38207/g.56871  ORF Transcript_38207/g.56871 Transcript_38207/m.56871 type:complete len:162 (+) Transcript_38207:10-495(+)